MAAYAGPAAEAGAPAPLDLDAYAALRADLAARADVGARGAAVARAEEPDDAVRAAAWLPLVAGLERAARLAPRERAAHFRRQGAAWAAAAEALDEPRYERVGGRLARWRGPDPRLSLVKELLWALEQPEARGYTRLALAGMGALGRLVPGDDVRAGYVLAQSARAVRTLGSIDIALEWYDSAGKLAQTHHDTRLYVRSAVGLGTTHAQLGNYPAARAMFKSVLDANHQDLYLMAAAHHGLMVTAMTAQDWDTALEEGWYLLRAEQSGTVPRADVLNLLAELCRRIDRSLVAVRAAEAALSIATRPDQTITALAVLVDTAATARDAELGLRYAPALSRHIGRMAGPFEDARALLALASFEHVCGSRALAVQHTAKARAIAGQLKYHELQFEADRLSALLEQGGTAEGGTSGGVCLNDNSQYIVSQLDETGKHDVLRSTVLA